MYLSYKPLDLSGNKFEEVSYINSRVTRIFEENNLNKEYIQATTRFIYGLKNKYADKNGIDVDYLINKLSILGKIEVLDKNDYFDKNPNVVGYFNLNSENSQKTPCGIYIREKKPKDELNEMDTYLHELVHLLSVDFEKRDNFICFTKNGLSDSLMDECVTETIKNEIMKEYIFNEENLKKLKFSKKIIIEDNIIDSGIHIMSIRLGSESSGYANINNVGELIKSLYGNDIFISKFTGDDSLKTVLDFDKNNINYKSIALSLKDIGNEQEKNNYLGLLNINLNFKDIVKNYFDNHDLSTEDYLIIRNSLLKYSNNVYISKKSDDLSYNGYENLSNKYLNEIDIKNIYTKIVKDCDIEKELNPYTRSIKCSQALISINYILERYNNFTLKDLKDIEIFNGAQDDKYIDFYLKIKDDVIYIAAERNPISLEYETIYTTTTNDFKNMEISPFRKMIEMKENNPPALNLESNLNSFSFSDILSTNITHDLENIKTEDSNIDFLYKVFTGNVKVSDIEQNLEIIKNSKDKENNNLTHFLILGEMKPYYAFLYGMPEKELWDMLTERNDKGKCTFDYLIDSNQFIKFEKISEDFKNSNFKYDSNLIKNNLYNIFMDNNRYIIENTSDSLELIRKIKIGPNIALETIKEGADCDLKDSKNYNACLYYAKVFNPTYTNLQQIKLFETLIDNTNISNMTYDNENIFSFLATKRCSFPQEMEIVDNLILKAVSKPEFNLELLNRETGDVLPSYISNGCINSVKKIIELGYNVGNSPDNYEKLLNACEYLPEKEREDMTKLLIDKQRGLIKESYEIDR